MSRLERKSSGWSGTNQKSDLVCLHLELARVRPLGDDVVDVVDRESNAVGHAEGESRWSVLVHRAFLVRIACLHRERKRQGVGDAPDDVEEDGRDVQEAHLCRGSGGQSRVTVLARS